MENITFSLAVLLASGFFVAKLGHIIQLPSVTGYIFAGVLLGPTGLDIITEQSIGDKLSHFISIALMLISFGVGEHLEIKRIKNIIKSIGIIGIAETAGAFLLVSGSTLIIALLTGIGEPNWGVPNYFALAMMLAAISIATAPATTLHVISELKAIGPLTTTLMAVVAIDNVLAIIFFGVSVSMEHNILGSTSNSLSAPIIAGFLEIFSSIFLGIITGIIIDLIVKKLETNAEMLTIGLALLLLSGEIARFLDYSPLLLGMAAGFTVINRDRRDIRIFRALNMFEAPIYVLFFTIAGTQLHIAALTKAGWLGISYFSMRIIGKIIGAYTGARIAGSNKKIQRYLGFSLMPQAGVAIGLIFLIKNDSTLFSYASIITPVVIAGIVISEIAGPPCAKFAFIKSGETNIPQKTSKLFSFKNKTHKKKDVSIAPFPKNKITTFNNSNESVLFGISNPYTVAPLTRIAAIMANYYKTSSVASYVLSQTSYKGTQEEYVLLNKLLDIVKKEADSLKCEFNIDTIHSDRIANGIIKSALRNNAKCIIIGYSFDRKMIDHQNIIGSVVSKSHCPVIVTRLSGKFDTKKVLVPITNTQELHLLQNIIFSFTAIEKHRITILHMLSHDQSKEIIKKTEKRIKQWIVTRNLTHRVKFIIKSSETLLETINEEAPNHDLIVMAASDVKGLQKMFFGSLGEDVARNCNKPLLVFYNPKSKKN